MSISLHLAVDRTKDFQIEPGVRIAGRVIHGADRYPVAGVSVWIAAEESEGLAAETHTDVGGHFAVEGLATGSYTVVARKGSLVGVSERMTLSTSEAQNQAEVTLETGRALRGRVTAADGTGLQGVVLTLSRAAAPRHGTLEATSTAGGAFEFTGLLPGEFRLATLATGYAPAIRRIVTGSVHQAVEADLTLLPEAIVRGYILDHEGHPVSDAWVLARTRPTEAPTASVTLRFAGSNTAGRFELRGLGSGLLTLNAQDSDRQAGALGPIPLTPGEAKEVTLQFGASSTLSGTIRYEDGTPAPGIRVETLRQGDSEAVWLSGDAVSNMDGHYVVGPLDPGVLLVAAARKGPMTFFANPPSPLQQRSVSLEPGERKTGVDLVVRSGGRTIQGVVLDPDGTPVAGAHVIAIDQNDARSATSLLTAEVAMSGRDGRFTVEDLETTAFTLRAMHPRYPDAEVRDIFSETSTVRLQFALPAALTGVVILPDGSPVQDCKVTVLPVRSRHEAVPQSERRRKAVGRWYQCVPSASSNFVVAPLTEGEYEVRAVTMLGVTGSTLAQVKAGERKTDLRIVIGKGVEIRGRVVEEDSGPVSSALVRVPGSGMAMATTHTDAEGRFALQGVPPEPVVRLLVTVEPETHVPIVKEITVDPGQALVDAGTITLARKKGLEKPDSVELSGKVLTH